MPRPPVVDIVIPVYNEQATLERSVLRLHAHLRCGPALHLPDHDRRQRQHRPDLGDRRPAGPRDARGACRPSVGQGPRPGAEPRCGRPATRPSWPTWTSTCPPTSPRSCRCWPRCSPGTPTWPSAPVWVAAPGSCAGRSGRSSPGAYNLIVRTSLGARFSDAQCGFKAIRADAAAELLPLVEDPEWFFDTELLVLAERSGMRIHEVPWTGSTTRLLGGHPRHRAQGPRGDLAARSGAELRADPAANPARGSLGRGGQRISPRDRQPARPLRPHRRRQHAGLCRSVLAAAFRDVGPVGQRGRAHGHRDRQHGGQPVVHLRGPRTPRPAAPPGAGPAGVRHRAGRSPPEPWRPSARLAPDASRPVELVVLTAANVLATLIRFLLYRAWVFADRLESSDPLPTPTRFPPPHPRRSPDDHAHPQPS